jgi:hypothetical protein
MTRTPFALPVLLLIVLPPVSSPAAQEKLTMTPQQASAFARLALKGIRKEYPNKPGDVLNDAADVKSPRAMHPAIGGPLRGAGDGTGWSPAGGGVCCKSAVTGEALEGQRFRLTGDGDARHDEWA